MKTISQRGGELLFSGSIKTKGLNCYLPGNPILRLLHSARLDLKT